MIIVFGSCTMDLLVPLPRLPRPGETVLGDGYEMRPGGKGANQAVAAVRAGGLVSFFGAIGDDTFGRDVRRALEDEGIEPDGLVVVDRPTATALVMIDPNGENQIAVAAGANLAATADQIDDAILTAESIVVLQMEVPSEENWKLLERTRNFGGRTVLNLAPALALPREMLPLIDVLAVNEVEAAQLAAQLDIAGEPAQVTRALRDITQGVVIMTLGARGSVAALPDSLLHVPPLSVDVVDTTGCGDAYVGALAAGLDAGLSWPDTLRRASVSGSLACRGFGARGAMASYDEINEGLQRLPAIGSA